MKKTSYHVNPAVNKWEEDQRRARMEKMIQRAKSTLPPEARGGAKPSGPKKPSPYSAEKNAARPVRKRASGGPDSPAGPVLMDAHELDGLIYNRVQEILGMPLMRRAAAAGKAGGTPPKAPGSSRGGRRPVWNNEWNVPTMSPSSNTGLTPSKPSSASPGGPRRQSASETTSARSGRPGAPAPVDVSPFGLGPPGSGLQRNTSLPHGADGRVVLLPSPSAPGPASRGQGLPRPVSSRYSGGMEAAAGGAGGNAAAAGAPPGSGHGLGHSVMSAIVALNPQSAAAQEAAARNRQQQQTQMQHQGRPSAAARPGGASGIPHAPGARPSQQQHQQPGSSGRDAPAAQSLTGMSKASGAGGMLRSTGSGRPPVAPEAGAAAARSSGPGGSAVGLRGSRPAAAHDEDEGDAYADDAFEEYEGSDEEGAGVAPQGEDGAEDEEGGEGGNAGGLPDFDILRTSVNALNQLVQLKIQQEVARSQKLPSQTAPGAASSSGAPPGVLDSTLPLVGTEAAEAQGLGLAGLRDLEESGVIDGLRQSDLDYLARLGGCDPHEHPGAEVASSTDDRAFLIEPGAPAGSRKAWGDRQPWTDNKPQSAGADATGLELLRARQEREREREGQQRGSCQGLGGASGGIDADGGSRRAAGPAGGAAASGRQQGDEEDLVLLGETITPRNHTGTTTAAQMQAVGSALAALASTGHLSPQEAQDLQSQTDALYGSLVQLHQLMTGPLGAELRTSPSSGGGAGGNGSTPATGFSPTMLSPADSPNQRSRKGFGFGSGSTSGSGSAGGAGGSGGGDAVSRVRASPPPAVKVPVPSEPVDALRHSEVRASGAGEVVRRDQGQQEQGLGQGHGVGGGVGAPGGSHPRPHLHMELTPKHQLVAEDVAWMAGLVQSLSKSLQVDPHGEVDLPGM